MGSSIGVAVIGATSSRSGMSVLVELGIGAFMSGDSYVSEQETDKKIEKRREKNEKYSVSGLYKTLYSFSTEVFEGNEVCYFGEETERKIMYFHGGSFMWQPLIFHFSFCNKLTETLGLQVVMPIYPKAPSNDYNKVLSWVYDFYNAQDGEFIFIGDSAGATIMLSLSQYLCDNGKPVPKKEIAISPVLDTTLSNPEIEKYAPLDPMLNRNDLARKMATYVNGGDEKSPYISPIYCDYSALGEVTVITGTHDIIYPDTILWDEKLTEEGIAHNYLVFENQNHVFPIYPIPERTVCLNIIKEILK